MSRSMVSNDSTEISRSWLFRISTKRDMCVPLKLCGSPTYMLNMAMVCWTPPLLSRDADRMADGLDADLVDREVAGIRRALHVWNGEAIRGIHCRVLLWSEVHRGADYRLR